MTETPNGGSPAVTILIVSDYAGGEEKSWNDLRKAFRAWTRQDFEEPVGYILVESEAHRDQVPADLFELLPECRVVFDSSTTSYELKNAGMEHARTEIVGIVDADCIPNRQWVRLMVDAMRSSENYAAVSGVTTYPGQKLLARVLGLLGRSYIDPGHAGRTRFLSGNAVGYRRSDYLHQPLPTTLGAFASRIQSEAMLRSGRKFYFDPGMRTVHDFEGWSMEKDVRRNQGYCTVITRLHDALMPHASLVRLGPLSIPAIVFGKMLLTCSDIFRCAPHYNVRWYEYPVALGLAVWTHLMEIPGMWTAYRGKTVTETAYR
jgi:glycosyl transferase family 2